MEIVTGESAPLDRDEAFRLLNEMAAVVRTIFAVAAPAQEQATPAPVITTPPPVRAPVAAIPVAGIPVPAVPLPVPEAPDSAERHSMALLQEIAFLDD